MTRNLPTAHWLTRWFRERAFLAAATRLTSLLHEINVDGCDVDQVDELVEAAEIAERSIELYLLAEHASNVAAHSGYLNLIESLRSSRFAIQRGRSPKDVISREEVRERGLQRLAMAFSPEDLCKR